MMTHQKQHFHFNAIFTLDKTGFMCNLLTSSNHSAFSTSHLKADNNNIIYNQERHKWTWTTIQ